MKFSLYSSVVIFFIHSYSWGMLEMLSVVSRFPLSPSEPASHTIEYNLPLHYNAQVEIPDDTERRDAAMLIDYLQGFKNVAEKTLEKHKDGFEKLSDREVLFLQFCIETNNYTCYKVKFNPHAVYKQLCAFDISTPTATMPAMRFWQALLKKKKIDQALFDEQLEQIKKFHGFMHDLITQGLICQYPRTVEGKVVYKAAL